MAAIVWKGSISFGLVSFPVRLFAAARAEAVHFHMLHKTDLSRIRQVWFCAEENEPIERSETVKGYETGEDKYVVVEEEELKKIAPTTATTMEILQFVGKDEVDPIYFESSYYVSPDGRTTTKPFSLFVAALAETGQNAIAQVAMHNREHVVIIRPSEDGLLLHTLFYQDELRGGNQVEAPRAKYTAKELDLAKSLINHLSAPFEPGKFKDTYRDNVKRLIEQKQKGQKITVIRQPRQAPVIDLMEALKRSLNSVKPQKKTPSSARRAGAKKTAGRRRAA